MARPGPPRTPSALNALRGNPGKRATNAEEPRPEALASIAPPAWLKAIGRETWHELAPELHRLGLLTVIDRQALAAGCRWWAIYRTADQKLRRGLVMQTPSGYRQAAPEVAIAHAAFKAAMEIFSRFGVTPSERTRLHSPQPKDAAPDGPGESRDPHDELAARRRARVQPPPTATA
jgi:P27 family predicted phage terminase small subunit